MSFDWKGLLGGIAPTIATVASGGNPLVGAAVGAISNAVFGKKDSKPEDVYQAVVTAQKDPLAWEELKHKITQENHNFELAMAQLGFKLEELGVKREEIAAGDRGSARGMQSDALTQEDKFAKRFIYWYAIGVTTVSFIYFFVVTLVKLDADQRQIANIILGFLLATCLGSIIAFFYGTTVGNLAKNKQLVDLAKQIPTNGGK